jgi:hypothetical protein
MLFQVTFKSDKWYDGVISSGVFYQIIWLGVTYF